MFLTGLARLASSSVVARAPIQSLTSQLRERIWHCSASPTHPTLGLHSAYRSLRKALRDPRPIQSLDRGGLLTRTDLHNALDVLAASAKLDDFLLIVDLLDDMMPLFGHVVTADTHRTVLRALADSGNTTALLKWLTTMPTKPGNIRPTLEFWHIFMEHCLVHSDVQSMSRGTHIMRSQDRPPTNATYEFLIRKVFMSSSHHFLWIIRIIGHMSRAGLPFDDALLATLLEGFNGLGLHVQASRVEEIYRSRLSTPQQSSRRRSGDDFNVQFVQALRTHGRGAVVELYRSLRGRGFRPSQATLISLVGDARNADDIAFWERTFKIKAGSRVWSKVVRNALLMRSPTAVLEIYRAAKGAGVPVDLPLAGPVIRSLCSSSLRSPTDAALDLAIEIYREIEDAPRTPDIGPRVALFQTLLRALSASANKTKYMPVAIDMLEEMKRRGLSDSAHVTSLVILLMRSASSFSEAFDAYKTVRERTQIPFQAKGYAAILHTFTTLKLDNRTIPPWQDYFQIVKDMQEDGSPVLPHLYTNMFRQMARMAARAKPSDPDTIPNLQKMVHTAREVQHLLSISTSVTLDTPFWNQLMDTYQRAGAFEDARRIWDRLFLEGRVDAASVSIIFDACGYTGAGRTACLCRLGQLDEAARYFCLEMDSHGVPPDAEGARILLKFANQRGVGSEVRMRIQRFLPALWKRLPSDIVGSPY
ncbi:hypothetical protein EDB86DRAFT_2886514 [Lactarius hatsudake]|nr:hypothetical protein EDB86DRAFT_2886514 [Lactarius hatsudake]